MAEKLCPFQRKCPFREVEKEGRVKSLQLNPQWQLSDTPKLQLLSGST